MHSRHFIGDSDGVVLVLHLHRIFHLMIFLPAMNEIGEGRFASKVEKGHPTKVKKEGAIMLLLIMKYKITVGLQGILLLRRLQWIHFHHYPPHRPSLKESIRSTFSIFSCSSSTTLISSDF